MPTIAKRTPRLGPLRLGRLADGRLSELAAAGDERAFEVLYDRHHRALLGFCRHMVGAREEAEDALQQTFLRAHRALRERGAPAELRPWLFTIARNCCLTQLAGRRPVADGEREVASTEGLGDQVQVRSDLRALVADVERLPDDQRAALVLAELADLSHDQIAEVIGVRAGKVKALIHQARTTLIAERDARETPCEEIREQLATARGGALRRGPLRRHLRRCPPCRDYRAAVSEQRRALGLALPALPSLGLKAGILGAASAAGGAGAAGVGGAGAAASLGGGLASKLAAAALVVGGATGGGVAIVDHAEPPARRAPATAEAATTPPRARSAPAHPVALAAVAVTPRRRSRPVERAKVRPHAAKRPHGKRRGPGRAERRRRHGRRPMAPVRAHARAKPRAHPARPAAVRVNGPRRAVRVKPAHPAKRVHHAKPTHPLTPGKG
jgi:RNA polymerase sigma factor (sigma-70 family)